MVLNLINFIQAAIIWILITPELLYSIHRQKPENKKNSAASITEQFGRYASMMLMILPLGVWEFGFASAEEMIIYFAGNGILLAAYIALWVLYFKKESFAKAIALAIINIAIFLLCGVLLRHWFLVVFALIFAFGHLAETVKKHKEAE
ncbi:MAG: hypothetical protein IJD62_04890 [Oscillospiraceae bacterium]|nr:hypothetical protein [Oscillospiraceae bacterium]